MNKQYTDFSRCVNIVAGKSSVLMGESIKQQEKISFMAFKPKLRNRIEYTDNDGNVDPDGKKFADDISKLQMKKVFASLDKFETDWTTMFSWIKRQMFPETLQRLMRSTDWQSIAKERDPGRLLKLLHIICMYGSDLEYPVETLLNAVTE